MVPEHRIPISVILRLKLSVEDMVEDMEIVNISLSEVGGENRRFPDREIKTLRRCTVPVP